MNEVAKYKNCGLYYIGKFKIAEQNPYMFGFEREIFTKRGERIGRIYKIRIGSAMPRISITLMEKYARQLTSKDIVDIINIALKIKLPKKRIGDKR